jgi:hypothetical protein
MHCLYTGMDRTALYIRWNELVQAQLLLVLVVALIPRTVLVVAQVDLVFSGLLAPSARPLSAARRAAASFARALLCCLRWFFCFRFRCRMWLRSGFRRGGLLTSHSTTIYIARTPWLGRVVKARDFLFDLSGCCILNVL